MSGPDQIGGADDAASPLSGTGGLVGLAAAGAIVGALAGFVYATARGLDEGVWARIGAVVGALALLMLH